jgi:periplasmic protein CpxP/Spy
MKTLLNIATLLAFVISTQFSFAQQAPKKDHNKHDRKQQFEEVSKKLNLTADQQTHIKAIMKQNHEAMKTLREANKSKAKEEQRKAMLEQMKKADGQINDVLDAQQKEAYKQLKAERKAAMQQKRKDKMKEREEMEEYQGIL